jgi:predicted dehydrogenase
VLSAPKAPVLLEARHYQFHPAWHAFLALFDPADVHEASAITAMPAGLFPTDDIRFKFHLAGGTMLDLGTYNLSALRGVFNADPVSVDAATPQLMPAPHDDRCDLAMHATYTFPNGGKGTLSCDLGARIKSSGTWLSWLFDGWANPTPPGLPPFLSVTLREKHGVEDDMQVTTQKTLEFHCFMGPHVWHRIDINTVTAYRAQNGEVLRTEKITESKKAYVWPQGKGEGEDWWTTYRYMLEGFVDRVKGRKGSGVWLDGEESIRQMESIDRTYEKAGMAIRPTSESLTGVTKE